VLGELIREPAPLRLRNVNDHPHAYGFPPGHPPMHTFLGVPITIRGETFGNLYMTEKHGGGEFDEEDEAAARTLAIWAGIAIENARLYTTLSEREAEVQRALRRAETSVDIARTVGGETDVDRILDLIVKRARALVDARVLLVLLVRGDHLFVAARAGEVGGEVSLVTVPTDGSVYGESMADRAPRQLEGEIAEGEFGLREQLEASSALVVPLVFRGYAVGTLVAFDREAGGAGFDQEDTRMLEAFGASAATAVATAQSVQSERLQQQVEISEGERRRWAQELHDDTLQGLAAIRISLAAALGGEADDRAERIESAATQTVDRLEGQIEELSRLINDLRPAPLERLGLVGALESLAEDCSARGGLSVDTEIEMGQKLSGEEERVVYRLVQEALNNVLKHSQATKAGVSARLVEKRLQIAVEDDGRGFDQDSVAGGRGLTGMRERIELLGGEIEIQSEPGDGTRVSVSVPMDGSD
jgi:signal transduction histidine kinase